MIKSLKTRILTWFILFSVMLLASVTVLNSRYFKKREEKNQLITRFAFLQNDMLKVINNSNAFFRNEISNIDFFETGKTNYLLRHDTTSAYIVNELQVLKKLSLNEQIDISAETDTILSQITEFNLIFNQVVGLILERGYKDYGVEGEMREWIHKLEGIYKLDQTKVLSLRRHEKDYIIRNETQYIHKLNKLSEKFKKDVIQATNIDAIQKDSIITIIDNYKLLFNSIVSLDNRIGIRDNSALKGELDLLSKNIENQIDKLNQKLNQENKILLKKARINYLILVSITIILSVILSLLITKKVTHSLIQLTKYISVVTKSNFSHVSDVSRIQADSEILMIYNEFNRMVQHLEKREKQRDKALTEVKAQELRYKHMADLLPLSLFEVGNNGNFSYVNKQWENNFEYYKNDWEQLTLNNIVKDQGIYKKITESDYLASVETIAISKSHREFPILLYTSLIKHNNEVKGVRGIIIDITDRVKNIEALKKAKKKAEESDKLKTTFLANMSHEIRTPMNAIIGFSDLLMSFATSNEDKKKYISQIQNSGKLLLKIIDDIIDIAKIEAGKISIRKSDFDVNKMMDEVHQHFFNTVQKSHTNLKLILEKELDGQLIIMNDPLRLKQVLINLISNAIKFTQDGFIQIGYEIKDSYLKFYVRDTGIGIPNDKLKLIFQRFRQADETLNRKYGGTGLGLAISENLVHLMGGEINVESTRGKGSTFYFTLPYNNIEHRNDMLSDTKLIKPKNYNWLGRTVLITEDDDASYRYLKELLKPTKINILRAEDGKEAINIFSESPGIDIILMDIHLPTINGYDATKAIKTINRNIPIIAQTAYAMSDEKKMCLAAGCNDYIAKPVKKDEVLLKMGKYLGIGFKEDIQLRLNQHGN